MTSLISLRNRPSFIFLAILILGIFVYLRYPSHSEEKLNWITGQVKELMSQYEELTESTFVGRGAEDPTLVAYIRTHEMRKPSDLPYNLTQPDRKDFSQYKQSTYADTNFLKGMTNGFFLEAGALDGEAKSNSLFFERDREWKGLLVEPDPKLYGHLVTLNRKAYSINAGFSLGNVSATASFVPARGLGRINNKAANGITIRTFPLYSMLLALGVSQVDFFSLDIEGAEQRVLDTIPWDKVKFRLICMEINKFKGGRAAFVKYFEDRGYTFLGVDGIDAWFGLRNLLLETMDVDAWLVKNKDKIVGKNN